MEKSIIQTIFLAFLVILLLPCMTQAISLGTLQKSSFAELEANKTAEFTILFWNLENSSSFVKLEPKVPEGFIVIILPSEFTLNQSKLGPPYVDGEYVQLAVGDVRAFPVKILIKALVNVEEGSYEIPILARAESFEAGIRFVQEKTFRFNINVTGLKKQGTSGALQKPRDFSSQIREPTGMIALPQTDQRFVFLAISILIILSISFLVYKFA